ncbi:MAG: outer membrane lipoprotein-sorting protein [Victivallales bacterium]|nr:outer membrane lipoprotein-sorting protein [Victivallales bacterium]
MQKAILTIAIVFLALCPFARTVLAGELTALEILTKSDAVVNAPADQEITLEMILIDKAGKEKTREAKMWQKGSDMRMIKFLSPADQKGIAFLDLPDDVMYLYMPAFKKVRRIASHVKNESFAGTDFTYDDMAALNYADEYTPSLLESDDAELYILELAPNKGLHEDYSKLVMSVRRDNFYPVRIEYYSKDGKLWKVLVSGIIEKIDGHWTAREAEMHDLDKNHRTKMVIVEVEFDQGLKDDLFTQRYLKRSAD